MGTLAAMVYQTGWMVVYNTRNLLKRPLGSVLKHFGVDLLTVVLICLTAGRVTLEQVSYLGWIVMAVKVVAITLCVMSAVALVFY